MPPQDHEKRIADLEKVIQDMGASATIPYDIGEAMGGRLIKPTTLDTTGKSLTSEQHAGGDAGLKNPEVWGEIVFDGTKHFVALYT